MPDTTLSGLGLGIGDYPRRGMQIRIMFPPSHEADGQLLEPAEAAELGRTLIALADEAMLAEQAKRRSNR